MNMMQIYASSTDLPYFMRYEIDTVTVSCKILYLWFFQLIAFLSENIFK